jgi:hypothetical protein
VISGLTIWPQDFIAVQIVARISTPTAYLAASHVKMREVTIANDIATGNAQSGIHDEYPSAP